MTQGQSAVGKALVTAGIMGATWAVPAPAVAQDGPCAAQFYQQAGENNAWLNGCLASSGFWGSAGCYVGYTVNNEAIAAIYASCLVFGHS